MRATDSDSSYQIRMSLVTVVEVKREVVVTKYKLNLYSKKQNKTNKQINYFYDSDVTGITLKMKREQVKIAVSHGLHPFF
jgi:hypothetical protein